jgi:hypothetical protein
MVFLDVVATNWQESAKADMKSKIFDLDAFSFELGKSFFGHVEAGGWSGGGAEFFSPDSLIALNVVSVSVAMEIWWKRNVAVGFDDIGEWTVATDGSGAITEDFLDGDLVVGIVNCEDIAGVKFAAVHDGIKIGFVFFEDDEFAWTAIGKSSKKTSAHDAGVVKDYEVAWFEKISNVGIMAVGDFTSLFIEDEQASSATDFWWTLSDILFREIVIKI